MFDFQSFEKELIAVLQSSIVRNDTLAGRIVNDFKLCRTAEDIVGVFNQLYQRIDTIEENYRSARGLTRAGNGISHISRINLRL